MHAALNDRTATVWAAILETYREHGWTPSARELARVLHRGYTGCWEDVAALERLGLLTFHPDRKRYVPADWRKIAAMDAMLEAAEQIRPRIKAAANAQHLKSPEA